MVNGRMVLLENVAKDYVKRVATGKSDEELKSIKELINSASSVKEINKVLSRISTAKSHARLALHGGASDKIFTGLHAGLATGTGIIGAVGLNAYKHNKTKTPDAKRALEAHVKELTKLEQEAEMKLDQLKEKEGV